MTWENGREFKSFTKDGKTTNFTYDINGMRTRKRTGNTITDYYYDDNNVLYGLRYQSDYFYFYYDGNGEISSMLVNNAVPYVFEKNTQGDVIGIINEDGQRVVKYIYDAWGNPLKTLDADGNDVTNGAWAKAVPFRYRGYIYDTETGLYYLQSRFYDPQTGRFVNADAYTNTGTGTPYSANMFAYCENNPVSHVDPTGYWLSDEHPIICEKGNFSGDKYSTVRYWSYATDAYPCESKPDYSAPFHGRHNGLEIGRLLYELARKVENDGVANTFVYKKSCKEPTFSISFLEYDNRGDNSKTNDAENKLKEILDNTPAEFQGQVILGMALHTLQDYFAHTIQVELYSAKNGYYPNGNYKDYSFHKEANRMFEVDDKMGLSNSEIEDNPEVFPWRYTLAKKITKKVYKKWNKKNVNKRTISKIYISETNKKWRYQRTTGILGWKKYWTLHATEYTLTVR